MVSSRRGMVSAARRPTTPGSRPDDPRALELEPEPHLAQPCARHRGAQLLAVARVEQQEAAAAGADELAAERAVRAAERVPRIDVRVGHPGRALALVLPVL